MRVFGQKDTKAIRLGQQMKHQADLGLHSGLSSAKGGVQLVDPGLKPVMEFVEMIRRWEFVGHRSR